MNNTFIDIQRVGCLCAILYGVIAYRIIISSDLNILKNRSVKKTFINTIKKINLVTFFI